VRSAPGFVIRSPISAARTPSGAKSTRDSSRPLVVGRSIPTEPQPLVNLVAGPIHSPSTPNQTPSTRFSGSLQTPHLTRDVPALGLEAAVLEAHDVCLVAGGDVAPLVQPVGGRQLVLRHGRPGRATHRLTASTATIATRMMVTPSSLSALERCVPIMGRWHAPAC